MVLKRDYKDTFKMNYVCCVSNCVMNAPIPAGRAHKCVRWYTVVASWKMFPAHPLRST